MGIEELRADAELIVLYAEIWGCADNNAWKKAELTKLLCGFDPTRSEREQRTWLQQTREQRREKRQELLFLLRDEIDSSLVGFKHDRMQAKGEISSAEDVLRTADAEIDALTLKQMRQGRLALPSNIRRQERTIQNRIERTTNLRDQFQTLLVEATKEETKFAGYYTRLMNIAEEMGIQLRPHQVCVVGIDFTGD